MRAPEIFWGWPPDAQRWKAIPDFLVLDIFSHLTPFRRRQFKEGVTLL